MRAQGSSGGHNGLKSLIGCFGQDFPRLRVGIGRGAQADTIDRVLGEFLGLADIADDPRQAGDESRRGAGP